MEIRLLNDTDSREKSAGFIRKAGNTRIRELCRKVHE